MQQRRRCPWSISPSRRVLEQTCELLQANKQKDTQAGKQTKRLVLILFQVVEILFRIDSILFQLVLILFQVVQIFFFIDPILFQLVSILFQVVEILFRIESLSSQFVLILFQIVLKMFYIGSILFQFVLILFHRYLQHVARIWGKLVSAEEVNHSRESY